jgi:hypothetical protein
MDRQFTILLAFVAACTVPPAIFAAPLVAEGTWAGNGHHYVVYYYSYEEMNELTWELASADLATRSPGYHLATSTSEDENNFIWSLLEPLELDGEMWLGGFQDPEQLNPLAGWHWVTGEPWSYTNWEFREPNDSVVGNENHLAYLYGPYWNDEGSAISSVRGYIGESAPSVVPIPPAAGLFGGALALLSLVGTRSARQS